MAFPIIPLGYPEALDHRCHYHELDIAYVFSVFLPAKIEAFDTIWTNSEHGTDRANRSI